MQRNGDGQGLYTQLTSATFENGLPVRGKLEDCVWLVRTRTQKNRYWVISE